MPDTTRESWLSKIRRNGKPESEKTTTEKGKDEGKSLWEKAASHLTPTRSKSLSQKTTDAAEPPESTWSKAKKRLSLRSNPQASATRKSEEKPADNGAPAASAEAEPQATTDA